MTGVFYLDSESLHALSRITRRRPMTDAEAVRVALVRMLADIEKEEFARGGDAPTAEEAEELYDRQWRKVE